jgi:hypothetical protein
MNPKTSLDPVEGRSCASRESNLSFSVVHTLPSDIRTAIFGLLNWLRPRYYIYSLFCIKLPIFGWPVSSSF